MESDNANQKKNAEVDMSTSEYVFVQGVVEKVKYKARIRLRAEGEVSPWSDWVETTIIGKTTPPPNITGFSVYADDPRGLFLSWDACTVFDFDHYILTHGATTYKLTANQYTFTPYQTTGKMDFSVIAVDTSGIRSVTPAKASCTITVPAKPVISRADLLNRGIVCEWSDSKTTWSIDRYDVAMSNGDTFRSSVNSVIANPRNPFDKGVSFTVRAKDVFNNWGSKSASATVKYYPPKTPDVTFSPIAATGIITADWEDCTNDIDDAPVISGYRVEGSLASNEKKNAGFVSGLHYESRVLSTNYHENGVDSLGRRKYYVQAKVTAVDKYGITCMDASDYRDNTRSVDIYAPATPKITMARLLDDGVNASWTCDLGTWELESYTISSCAGTDIQKTNELNLVYPCPAKWTPNSTLTLMATDIVSLNSDPTPETIIEWYAPKTPDVTFGYNKLTGGITVDWEDCRNTTVENAPRIAYYDITGTLANTSATDKSGIVRTSGTHYESIIPLQVYEYGTQRDTDGIMINVGTVSIQVTAVDKYGVTCKMDPNYKDNTKSFHIYPPYNPTNFGITASVEGDSLILTWADCERTFAIDYYVVRDGENVYKVATNYVVLPSRGEGTYNIFITAYDVLGQESATMLYSLNVAGVGGMEVNASIDGADILVEWTIPDSSFNIDYYIVSSNNDNIDDIVGILKDMEASALNDLSSDVLVSATVEDVDKDSKLDSVLLDAELLTGADVVSGSIAVPGFVAQYGDGQVIGKAKTNYFRVPAGKVGTYIFYVWAVDVAGNVSTKYASYAPVTISAPNAPRVFTESTYSDIKVSWETEVNSDKGQLPIVSYDIIRLEENRRADGIIDTIEESYGNYTQDTFNAPPVKAGTHYFYVRAIDSGGNMSEQWGDSAFVVMPPSPSMFVTVNVIVNQVQFWWVKPALTTFDIAYYTMYEVESGYRSELLQTDALYATQMESAAKTVTYGLTAVDIAGNESTMVTTTQTLESPQGFVLYHDVDSLFNGTKTHMILDGEGCMIGPVVENETWNEHLTRTGYTTWQSKVNADNDSVWMSPAYSTGSYEETVDVSVVVPSSKITISATYDVLDGTPTVRYFISRSKNGTVWTDFEEESSLYADDFRHVKYRIEVSGGIVSISNINMKLDVQRKSDFGTSRAFREDCVDSNGALLPASSIGTWVNFSLNFSDVETPISVTPVLKETGQNAFVVFNDTYNPTGFRIALFDKQGNPITGDVMWEAHGV